MPIVDDPMLALIARFVVAKDRLDIANQEFLKRQIKAIEKHVSRFPKTQIQSLTATENRSTSLCCRKL